ncbi:GNAT family N-acetyltransferase [Bradyrhizobium prioriisuperbiae]|uniref:GNAT family N-acetyltransferase n=1 Tax=Bradyrhizobium prioriisuperbiae TaxID=2854389 RepID=UPI0028E3082E|nr:GNAT family N-acetyltransferase [Bradyrhizobium prioritasuperba]
MPSDPARPQARITIRDADPSDTAFMHSLSPRLSGVPGPVWHTRAAMDGFQDRHMAATVDAGLAGARTLMALSEGGQRLGYIHLQPGKDGVTDEPCGYVAVLALVEEAEGQGVAAQLMAQAEAWARAQGYRFLSLDVFADNVRAIDVYTRGGFGAETIRMVKPLT